MPLFGKRAISPKPVAALALMTMTFGGSALAQTLEARSIKVGNSERIYSLYVSPACTRPGAACPLVLGFHGGGLRGVSGEQLARSGGFVAAARRRNVVMAFPTAIDSNWNDGRPGISEGVDDVGFVRALIAQIRASVPGMDARRVYATGTSNGGHLSFRLACEMPGMITAIAPVAATLSTALSQRCASARPVSVLNILGELDPISPYQGGVIKGGRGEVLSADQTLQFWRKANRCDAAATERRDGALTIRSFDRCAEQTKLRQLSLSDGGHTWPGHPGSQLLARLVGPTSASIDATAVIFEFFRIPERGAR